ncbi:MAG: TrmH family RNA methyltransferase [Erysipelotrichaceae bacterium]
MAIVEGKIAVKAVLDSKYRHVKEIFIDETKHNKDIAFIINQANQKNIKTTRISPEEICQLAKGKTHGGVLAEAGERKTQSVVSLLKQDKPFLALLEGIEDSYNLGYILRTLYAFGCDGVIMKQRYEDFDDSNLIKSSAGASELIPLVYSDKISETVQLLKQQGIVIVAAYRGSNAVSLYDYDFKNKGVLVEIGGPLRGLSSQELADCDDFIYIPYANDFRNALNAASATSVIAGEIFRQKINKEAQ